MEVSYIFEHKDLNKINDILSGYESQFFPRLMTKINNVKVDDQAKLRVTLDGNETDIKNVVDIFSKHFFFS
jgi:hypothetical protein